MCKVPIVDDPVFEGTETLYVQLSHPEFTLLGDAARATVIINDQEDGKTNAEFFDNSDHTRNHYGFPLSIFLQLHFLSLQYL